MTIHRHYNFITDRNWPALHRALLAAGALTVECVRRNRGDQTVLLKIELPPGLTGGSFALRLWDTPWCGGEVSL